MSPKKEVRRARKKNYGSEKDKNDRQKEIAQMKINEAKMNEVGGQVRAGRTWTHANINNSNNNPIFHYYFLFVIVCAEFATVHRYPGHILIVHEKIKQERFVAAAKKHNTSRKMRDKRPTAAFERQQFVWL